MKLVLSFGLAAVLFTSCITVKVYENPSAIKPNEQLLHAEKLIRSGEEVDFGSHKAKVFYFTNDKRPRGVWHAAPEAKDKATDSVVVKMERQPPLLILEGKRMPKSFSLDALNPSEIEYVSVLKDSMAVAKYGEEARDGVIEIGLKKRVNN